MSEHLESHLVSRCVLGEPSARDKAHLALCPACRRELDRFERALRAFRGSVRQWSDDEFAAVSRPRPKWIGRPAINAPWSMALILLLSLLGLRVSFHQHSAERMVAVANDTDAAWMDLVRADVARAVPRAMEPLLTPASPRDDNAGEPLP